MATAKRGSSSSGVNKTTGKQPSTTGGKGKRSTTPKGGVQKSGSAGRSSGTGKGSKNPGASGSYASGPASA